MSRHPISRQAFKVAVLGLAALGGLVECAALLRARLTAQLGGSREA